MNSKSLGSSDIGRDVYVDLGSNNGLSVKQFQQAYPDYIIFAFEPTPRLAEKIRKDFSGPKSRVHVMEYAAWIIDGQLEFYLGDKSDQSFTLLINKKAAPEWTIDYLHPTKVKSLDFGKWFEQNTSNDDNIVVKMDIEGAEYRVLRRMLELDLIRRISEFRVEWHWDRYPSEITYDEHVKVRDAVSSLTHLIDWG